MPPPAKPNGRAAAPAQAPLLQFPHDAQEPEAPAPTEPPAAPAQPLARTKLDFILAEVMGEVGEIVSRLEKVSARVVRADKEGEVVRQLIGQAHENAAANLRALVDERLGAVATRIEREGAAVRAAAQGVQRDARRMATLALVIGFSAGVLGGALAVVVAVRQFL